MLAIRASIAFALLCFLSACGGSGGGQTSPASPSSPASPLVGIYDLTGVTAISDGGTIARPDPADTFGGTLVLNNNGTVSWTEWFNGASGESSGTWQHASGTTILVTWPNDPYCTPRLWGYTLSNGVLTITLDHPCGYPLVYTYVWVRTGPAPA